MAASLPPDKVLGPAEATSAVIFSHGLGDTSAGWADTVQHALLPQLPHTRFILPTAKRQPVTINGGMPTNSWYDIESLSTSRSLERCAGLEDSVARIQGLVGGQVAAGIPHDKIALVGFSQGGALSLFSALTWPGESPLGGAFVLSGYMPRAAAVKPTEGVQARTRVRLYHGDEDGVVPLIAGQDAEKRARGLGVRDVSLKVYGGLEHSASAEELSALAVDLRALFAPRPTAEALEGMSVKQLKAFLVDANMGSARIAACVEKGELLALAQEALK
jgi:phospholipase/carboxylesterase